MADTQSRRMTIQAAIAAGLLVAGLVLIARPSNHPAAVTTHFETVAHSKLSRFDIEDITASAFVDTQATGFVPPPCTHNNNLTSAVPISGLCSMVSSGSTTHCCTFNPIPEDTTGCSVSCAQQYISFFCFASCSFIAGTNASCSSSMLSLFTACNTPGCNVLQAQPGQQYGQWQASQHVPVQSNASCSNFTQIDIPPCAPSAVPTVTNGAGTMYFKFLDTSVGANGIVWPGVTSPVSITSQEMFGIYFQVQNPQSGCSLPTPPVKAVISITIAPTDKPSPEIVLGNFTVWSPRFVQNTTSGTGQLLWEVDTTLAQLTQDLVQIDPTTGSGTITARITAYNFLGQSATQSMQFAITASTTCTSISCGPSLVIPFGINYSPDDTTQSTFLSNLTLLGNNIIDGRSASHALVIGQLSIPDNVTTGAAVTFKNIQVQATNLSFAFGAGQFSNSIFLIGSTLTITGSATTNFATSNDYAQLCICGDANSQFILQSGATFVVDPGVAKPSNTPNNLVFCGHIQAIIQLGATLSINTGTAIQSTEGLGIIDGASLWNSGTINAGNGIVVLYTTGTFNQNGTFTNSSGAGVTVLFLVAGQFNETIPSLPARISGPQSPSFLAPFQQCEPTLVVAAPVIIQLCGTNTTNLTVGANSVAVVGNAASCNTGNFVNGTNGTLFIISASVFNLIVLPGGVVAFHNVDGTQGILAVLGTASWSPGSIVAYNLVPTVNNEETFIPLMVCINQVSALLCCSPIPTQNNTITQNGITATLACLQQGMVGYPLKHKFGTKAVPHPAALGVVITKFITPPPTQVNNARFTSLNTYCIEINEDPNQFPASSFLADVQSTLGISSAFVNILLYGTDSATGLLKITFSCSDFSSSAAADVTCNTIQTQALTSGTAFNVQVQGRQSCGVQVNTPPNAHTSNKALFGLFALALIPLLICFLILLLILNRRRAADNQYMQDTATFSNVASSPQNVAYAGPTDKYYPNYPTPTPIGYYP